MNLSLLAIQKALANEWEEAIILNEQIVAEDPTNVDALNRLAQAYLHTNQISKAEALYLKVLELDQFNPIAKRNTIKLKSLKQNGQMTNPIAAVRQINFIEEYGKTKIVSLVRLGERPILTILQPGLELESDIRCQGICFYYQKQYVGRLPDDIAKRLIWLHKRDNRYSTFVKSVDKNRVTVFIKEVKQSPKNKNYASFLVVDRNDSMTESSDSLDG